MTHCRWHPLPRPSVNEFAAFRIVPVAVKSTGPVSDILDGAAVCYTARSFARPELAEVASFSAD
jgi:hypothetical protein